jgi:ribosomal protein L11 methyltransferase
MTKEEPRYPTVAVTVPESEADEASGVLFELGALGLEERDGATHGGSLGPGAVVLIASFGELEEARRALSELPDSWNARIEEVVGDAWRDAWKEHFEPFVLCERRGATIVVRPPWRDHGASEGELVLELEPGRAFGTGLHETTRLVAEALAETASLTGARVLDVGCGSGILSLVALALGAEAARAIDVDPDAVAVTRENAERNGWADRVEADTTTLDKLDAAYPVVVANIEARPLVALAPLLVPRVAPGGTLVLSGILAPEIAPAQWPEVRRAYAALSLRGTRQRGEWMAAVLAA